MENPARRIQIGEAAVHVIAREGCRGLTHRAVDREARLPIGTTINYHRTREDLLVAAAKHLIGAHVIEVGLRDVAETPMSEEGTKRFFTELVAEALGAYRAQYLVAFELLLEGVRRPRLKSVMTSLYAAEVAAMAELFGNQVAPETLHRANAAAYGLIHGRLTGVPELSDADVEKGIGEIAARVWREKTTPE